MATYIDHREAGHTIFGLNGVDNKGNCECGNPECTALYKHPRMSNWQHVPFYSEEQFEVMESIGHLATGYGVLIKDIFVIDVDARNGGLASYTQLCKDTGVDFESVSGYVVETGSADGSMHIYFKAPVPPKALMQAVKEYPGVDFKSSGFVVGSGSKHRSGSFYEVKKGFPQDLTEMPVELVRLLEKKTQYRATGLEGDIVDIEVDELRNVVMHIQDGGEYQRWVDVGMALHDTTQGGHTGLTIWEEWSLTQPKYEDGATHKKWPSFGKGTSLLSLGTLIHLAKQGGYIQPVTFSADVYAKNEPESTSLDDMIAHIDIRKPPKWAGDLCDWINSQCRYPRENLAAAATLYVLSCVGGMRHFDDLDRMSLNFMPFGVAGSASGKEAIFQAIVDCLSAAGLMPAVHGSFKSEQEAVRNLLRHQASFYLIDELGIELKKISQASQKGGAAYLAGLIGFFMKAYSKADGVMPVSGDLKEDIKDSIKKDIERLNKKADKDGLESVIDQIKAVELQLIQADNGLVNPFFNMFGLTTPVTFDDLVDHEMATNGFIARATIFREHETNPKRKKGFKSAEMPLGVQLVLSQLYQGGHTETGRIERQGNKVPIVTTGDAAELLDQIDEYFYDMAEQHKTKTGLEAICRRGWEICSKISLLTAMPSATRTTEDVLYGFAVAKWDITKKLELAYGNEAANHKETRGDALVVKVKSLLDHDTETTLGQLRNRLRAFKHEQIDEALSILVKNNVVELKEHKHKSNGTSIKKYKLL